MTDNFQEAAAGNTLFEAFIEQIKQALEHLYDFAYLQQHSLARFYDDRGDLSAKTAGRQLRHDIIKAIESLKPSSDTRFRAPDARLYELLQLYYIENLTIQVVADELGLSERQAYRDLKRGQEIVASILWNNRLPQNRQLESLSQDFSLESEVARLKLNLRIVDITAVVKQAFQAVERLALQQSVELVVATADEPVMVSTDSALAHQLIVSLMSFAIQQMQSDTLSLSLTTTSNFAHLTLQYRVKDNRTTNTFSDSVIPRLAQRLLWNVAFNDTEQTGMRQVMLYMSSSRSTILVIDDSDGWIELLDRYLEGFNCQIVSAHGNQDIVQLVQELRPRAIILDVMMPEKDGWEILQRLRANSETADIAIIVCSIFDDPQLAYSLGASRFVSKPANRDQIREVLKQLEII